MERERREMEDCSGVEVNQCLARRISTRILCRATMQALVDTIAASVIPQAAGK